MGHQQACHQADQCVPRLLLQRGHARDRTARVIREAAASSIQAGISWARTTAAPTRLHRAEVPLALSITPSTRTDRPAQGCHAYATTTSSPASVLWVLWVGLYNTVRPHSALGNVPPAAYANVNASGVQRAGGLEIRWGSAPRPFAPPGPSGSNEARTLLIPG
jgi:hypothetical protein